MSSKQATASKTSQRQLPSPHQLAYPFTKSKLISYHQHLILSLSHRYLSSYLYNLHRSSQVQLVTSYYCDYCHQMMLMETTREATPNRKQLLPFFSNFFGMLSPKKPGKTANLLHVPRDLPTLRTTPRRPGGSTVLERVFRNFDEDGDGKMSPAELSTCMRTIGEELSAEDAEAVVVLVDSDGDGLLGFEDFLKLVEVEEEEENGRSLREAFGVYEMEGEDCITPKSLCRALERLGQSRSVEECEAMIQRFDLDGDGVISFDEFRVMML